MSESHEFETRLAAAWRPDAWRDVGVLLAVSGGADSMALLRAFSHLKVQSGGSGEVVVAHVNHALRGEASIADEQTVATTCQKLELPCEVGRVDPHVLRQRGGDGLEATARNARYEFLRQTAEQLGARYVATAHTADDQVETVLHHIVRGTGISGLAGIRRVRSLGPAVSLMRPMLDFWRHEVVAYLDEIGQPYCVDLTNAELYFTRNRIRHELLPHIEERYNSNVRKALLRLAANAGEVQSIVDRLIEPLMSRAVEQKLSGGFTLAVDELADQPRYLVRELARQAWRTAGWSEQAMGFAEWDRLATLLLEPGNNRREVLPGGVEVTRTEDRVTFAPGRQQ